MKFATVASFEKHIKESSLSHAYLILCGDRQERLHQIDSVVCSLKKKCPDVQVVSFDSEEHTFSVLAETLTTKPLFSPQILCCVEDLGPYLKKYKEAIIHLLARPAPYAFFVAGITSVKESSFITSEMKNDVVVLDLTQEKPWQKAKRYQAWLVQIASFSGKNLSYDVAERIVETLGADSIAIEAELNKIITYVGDRKAITFADVVDIGVQSRDEGGWAMAEKLLFDGVVLPCGPAFDMGAMIALLGQLRYFLHGILDIIESSCGGRSPSTTLRPALLDKVHILLQKVSPRYFDDALAAIFKAELLCKNSTFSPAIIWDTLAAHIIYKRKGNAKTCSTNTTSQRP